MQESTNRAKVSKKEDNGKSGTLKPDFGWGEKHKKFLVSCESVSSRFVPRQILMLVLAEIGLIGFEIAASELPA